MSLLTPVLHRTARRATLRAGHVVAFGLGAAALLGAAHLNLPPRVRAVARAELGPPPGWVPVLVPIAIQLLLSPSGRR